MMVFEMETRVAQTGRADSLVVLIHGYGADGHDLIGLADPMAAHLPSTTFVSPHAPHVCTINPMGRQWFPIPMMDTSSEAEARTAMLETVQHFHDWLDGQMVAHGVTPDRVVLMGFSQGTMMALHVGPRRADQLAGIVGFSGRLLEPDSLHAEMQSTPPVLLVHGDMDTVVPMSDMPEAETALKAAGFDVTTHISEGTGHGIAPDGLGLAVGKMKAWL